jgi:hypothetical protein
VSDTIYAPDGTLLNGQILVRTTATWTSEDGYVIFQGFSIYVPVIDGVFSIGLVPNAGSNPASTYSVRVQATQGYFDQTWDVPQPSGSPPAPVDLAQVIVN